MSMEAWLMLAVSGVVVPSVAWLVREVLALRGKMIAIETRLDGVNKGCERHQRWNEDTQAALHRMDKNITRLCQKAGILEQ